ncbi:MAG: GspMb/PilO family protein [Vicinamibacteria bacterium]
MSARLRWLLVWTASGLGLVNLVAFLAYTAPRAARKRDVAARTAALDTELASQRTQVQELRERAETISANRRDARAFIDAQVGGVDASVVPILTEVESLARKQGLQVGRQSFAREVVKGLPVERFGIVMPVEGGYRQITGLVGELEASPTFVTLDKVSVRTSGTTGGAEVGLDMEFSFYFRAGGARGAAR